MLKVDSRVKFRAYICCNLYYIVSENKVLQLKMDYESKDISKENVVDTLSIEIDEGEDQIGCCQKFCCCCNNYIRIVLIAIKYLLTRRWSRFVLWKF